MAPGDWPAVERSLDECGYALLAGLLSERECTALRSMYDDDARFRSRVDMAQHRFGAGEYKYFAHPLPAAVQRLRQSLYRPLASIANRWAAALDRSSPSKAPTAVGADGLYPLNLDDFLERCHQQGQTRPTPLLLRYQAGGYNCLHQDLYGPLAFPLQVTVLLSRPGGDFDGGEFLLVEQRPRAQSRGQAVALEQAQAIVFPTHHRPVQSARGFYRATIKHGVSPVRSGQRSTLGIIFHDAK